MLRRGRIIVLLACGLALGVAAEARAQFAINANATLDRGYISLIVWAPADVVSTVVTERGETMPIAAQPMPAPADGVRTLVLLKATRWRCDRLTRVFTATGTSVSGAVLTSTYSVRTPSCRNRLVLRVPRRVEPGTRLRARLRDTWGIGQTSARACFRGTCRAIEFADQQATAGATFPAGGRGRADVVLHATDQRVAAPVAVGVRPRPAAASGPSLLLTGDSMMQSVEAILGERLGRRARVTGDVRMGTGLSSTATFDWLAHARGQVRRHHPNAAVMFLGTVEGAAMTPPGAAEPVACCERPWIDEYARRARTVMRTYAQDGAGHTIWITVPAAREAKRNPVGAAVNVALAAAAADVPSATLLRADRIFTPNGYRAYMTINGRRTRVRQQDGVHLTTAGAKLVATKVVALLRRSGLP